MKNVKCLLAAMLICSAPLQANAEITRTAIPLSPQHRAMVVGEMHEFLRGLQQISDALSREDMESVSRVARSLGTAMSRHMPAELKHALPEEFRKLGHSVHSDFDQIALDAESLGDSSHALSQLSQTLSGCVSCHGMYQIRNE